MPVKYKFDFLSKENREKSTFAPHFFVFLPLPNQHQQKKTPK